MNDTTRARALVDVLGPTLRGLLAGDGPLPIVVFDDADGTAAPTGESAGTLLAEVRPETTADEVLPLLYDRVVAHRASHGVVPAVVVVPGLGLFASGPTWAQADAARRLVRQGGTDGYRQAPRAPPTAPAASPGRWPSSPALRRASATGSPPTSSRRAATWSSRT